MNLITMPTQHLTLHHHTNQGKESNVSTNTNIMQEVMHHLYLLLFILQDFVDASRMFCTKKSFTNVNIKHSKNY